MNENDETIQAEGAASTAKLGQLHGVVATVLTDAIQGEAPSAALLGAAITFLKNNNITASPTENAELAALSRTLAARRKRKQLSPQAMQEAQDQFAAMNSGNGMLN